MKTAIYIEDGVVQLVLTPESDFEKNAIGSFQKKPLSIQVFDGAFYDCRGGWVRQKPYYHRIHGEPQEENSLILRIEDKPTPAPRDPSVNDRLNENNL